MRFRYAAIILLAAITIVGGSQLRIAKIYIMKPSHPRTVFRVFAPGRDLDAITTTVFDLTDGEDSMCHLYDWYGFRELDGGFGLATR